MTEKDPKDMTASELLRWCAAEDGMLRVSCTLCMKFYQTCGCGGHRCEDLLKDIADKIDAEIEAARRDAAKEPRKPMFAIRRIIASGTDWPEPREGEGLRDWLERCWLPRPRYEDGEPVRLGCAVCGGIVGGFSVWDDGAFTTYDKDGNVLQDGDPGDFVKRPESKALDVDGVETKAGDTVWLHDKVDGGPVGEPMKVAEVLCDGTLVFEGGGAMPARLVTHREPDSLEKLRDFVEDQSRQESGSARNVYREIADRLTDLIEMGA